MEKIKLIILFFSCLSLAQVETYSSLDIVSIEKKGDSLFNAKNFTKASEYFKKLISHRARGKPVAYLTKIKSFWNVQAARALFVERNCVSQQKFGCAQAAGAFFKNQK